MIRNYFKIAIRSLIRNRAFTLINMLGLVLGISFSTMLYTYVSHELSYDSFHQKSDRTYRILTQNTAVPGNIRTFGRTAPPLGPEMMNTIPEVEDITRLFRFSGQVVVEIGEEKYSERNWFTTEDTNFFKVFEFEFVAGDKSTALTLPFSVVLEESAAKKYFGDESALGKTMNIQEIGIVKVTGVIKDIPDNSHLQFDLLFSKLLADEEWQAYLNNWQRMGAYTYLVLKEGKSIDDIAAKMPAFMKQHMGSEMNTQSISFQPIQDIYLHSANIQSGAEQQHGQLSYVYIFSSMAVFLLILAAINYINLTTSKASSRSKEIGIRKVAGAVKRQLIFQFLTEAFVITFVSMLLALVVMNLCFPFFNSITGKNFVLSLTTVGEYMPALLCITLIIGVLAGSYPAFYLSKLKPIATLKGLPMFMNRTGLTLRTTLVIFQFTITIVLIISTLIIGSQLNYLQTKDIGFNKDQLMIVDINSGEVRSQFEAMKDEFSKLAGVQHVAVSSRVPGEWKNIREIYMRTTSDASVNDSLHTYFMGFDEDMLATYQLQLNTGNYFMGHAADSMNVLINASAAKALRLENPVGSMVSITTQEGKWNVRVIGVLEDFNFQSLHQKIAPIVIGYHTNPIQAIDYFTLKVSGDTQAVIEGATAVCDKFDPATPIEYHFLSEQLNNFYVSEKKAGMIFKMAGALSIIVACLGLLGLASYHIERKKKELGIRKILGAGFLNLFLMVSLSFTRQIVLAFVLACPLAWYIMRDWLSAFEYRITLHAGTFILAGVSVLLLTILTVSYQSLKAATFNPIQSMQKE